MNPEAYKKIHEQLLQPFQPEEIEFRPARARGDALAYADLRTYISRLNTVCAGIWNMVDSQVHGSGDQTVMNVCISIEGVTQYGVSDPDTPTKAFAQAFKRAAANHGLGLFLYRFPTVQGHTLQFSDDGKRITTDHLSIAVWGYKELGFEVSEETLKKLNTIPEWKLYNPNKRIETTRSEQPRYESKPSSSRGQSGLSENQIKPLLKAGLTEEEINALGKKNGGEAVGMVFKGATADDIRAEFLRPPVEAGARW